MFYSMFSEPVHHFILVLSGHVQCFLMFLSMFFEPIHHSPLLFCSVFRQGMHDLRVWPSVEADGAHPTTTPGKVSGKHDEMSRLSKLSKKHRNGHMAKVDWLDRLTFREIEMINEQQKRTSNFMYLMIEFPHIHGDSIEYSIIYFEMVGTMYNFYTKYLLLYTFTN